MPTSQKWGLFQKCSTAFVAAVSEKPIQHSHSTNKLWESRYQIPPSIAGTVTAQKGARPSQELIAPTQAQNHFLTENARKPWWQLNTEKKCWQMQVFLLPAFYWKIIISLLTFIHSLNMDLALDSVQCWTIRGIKEVNEKQILPSRLKSGRKMH